MNKKIYEFGAFSLDLAEKRLTCNGQTVSIQPKAFDLLVYFVENHGELVSRDDLMKAVWSDTFVEETNLRFCIHALRKALGKNDEGDDYVETIPKRGYRFTPEVNVKFSEISIDGISEKTAPSNDPEKLWRFNRKWLLGAAAILLVCFLIAALAWQKNQVQSPKNVLGFNQLAVLPFEAVAENERKIQIGLMVSIITNLSKHKQLNILPLSSVRKFTEQNFNALQAGKELGVDAVLSGNYRFDGENIIVTVNLLRVSDGTTLWTENFTAKGKTNLERESSTALRTARLLSLKIAETEAEQSLVGQNLNKEAVQNYLAARKIWRTGELNRRKEMIGLFVRTIELEPAWSIAYSGYAEAMVASDQILVDWEKSRKTAEKAIELDVSSAQAHTVLGEFYQWREWNWERSEDELKRAIELDPDYAASYHKYSQFLRVQRRFAEAEAQLNKAVEIEPFSPIFYSSFCELYIFDRKIEKALEACGIANQLEPGYWRIPKLLYAIYVERKMYAELGELVLGKLSPAERASNPLTKALAENDLRSFWQSLIDERSKKDNVRLVQRALLYLRLGEKGKALDDLELALKQRDNTLPTVNGDTAFDPIRNEKRFTELMRKIGLQK